MKDKSQKHSMRMEKVKGIKSDGIESTNDKKVVFSFENFQDKKYGLCEAPEEFKELVKQLKHISQLDWQTIQNSHRHGLGSEEIPVEQLRDTLPPCYANVKKVLSFRYSGKKPFIGIRNNQILDILFIDPNFDLYPHN